VRGGGPSLARILQEEIYGLAARAEKRMTFQGAQLPNDDECLREGTQSRSVRYRAGSRRPMALPAGHDAEAVLFP